MGEISIKTHLQVIEKHQITINDFKKQIIYGAGGFSIVYKSKFLKTGKVFAIKEIPKSLIINKKSILSILQRIQISTIKNIIKNYRIIYYIN